MKKLKILLKSNLIYFLVLISLIYVIIYVNYNNKTSLYNIDDNIFIVKIEKIRFKDNQKIIYFKGKETLISYYLDEFNYEIGDYIKIKGYLEEPSNNTIPNSFNYKNYLNHQDIYYILNIEETELIKKNNNIIFKIKNIIQNRINNIDTNKDYLYAFILGETYYIDSDMKANYQYLGVSHLLAIGSTNVMLITFLLSYLFKKYKLNDYLYLILMSILIFIYIILTDYSVSIIRCGLMFIISFINTKFKINTSYKNILLLVFSISLIINPNYIYDLGFQYSYLISFTLITCNKLFTGNYFINLFKISFISQLVSLPITIFNNYEINLLSLLVNLIYVPFINFIIFPISIIVIFIPNLNFILTFLINILENITNILSKFDFLTFIFRKPNTLVIIIYFLLIILSLYGFLKNKKYLIIPLIILMIIHNNINSVIKENYVLFLDVKQGDSIILKSNNKLALIDTGGSIYKDYSENTINYIKSIGMTKIDYLIITHGDYDHMGSATNLINNFTVNNVIFNCGDYNDLESELIEVLKEKNINYYSCISKIKLSEFNFNFLNTGLYDDENSNSSVIYFNYNNLKFLFMGDASIERENDILEKYNLNNIDFLKIGHHGSNTSSSNNFISKLKPKYSIISVGSNNRYGHPKESVLNILKNNNSKIYRTDIDGSIEIKINKNRYKIRTCSP